MPRNIADSVERKAELRGVLLYLSAEIIAALDPGMRVEQNLQALLSADHGELRSVELTQRQWILLAAACSIAAESL